MTAWWKCCIPVSAWFVYIVVIALKLETYSDCWNLNTNWINEVLHHTEPNFSGFFSNPETFWPARSRLLGNVSETLTKHNINSLQTLSDSSEGLCHAATGAWEQRVIWPIRCGCDLGGQIGSVTVGWWPKHWGCHPWTSGSRATGS